MPKAKYIMVLAEPPNPKNYDIVVRLKPELTKKEIKKVASRMQSDFPDYEIRIYKVSASNVSEKYDV